MMMMMRRRRRRRRRRARGGHLVLHKLGVDVIELADADGSCLAHVLCDLLDADAPHRAHRQRADQRVSVLRVLREGAEEVRGRGDTGSEWGKEEVRMVWSAVVVRATGAAAAALLLGLSLPPAFFSP
eukprot:963696-Rhodomonas_salina.1